MKNFLRIFVLLLVAISILSSCELIDNTAVQDTLFGGRTPSELYNEAMTLYETRKNNGSSFATNVTWVTEDRTATFDINYGRLGIQYKASSKDGDDEYTDEAIFLDNTIYFNNADGKRAYTADRDDINTYIEEYSLFTHLVPTLPHKLPENWFTSIMFIPESTESYYIEFVIDQGMSMYHPDYNEFFANGSSIRIYFTMEGYLDKFVFKGVYAAAEAADITVDFDWTYREDFSTFDTTEYAELGELELHKIIPYGQGYGLEFTSNGDGTCVVSGLGSCRDLGISIPATSPEGDTVTAIDGNAFHNCKAIKGFIIPNGVKTIETNAFYGCESLESISIPSTVSAIKAFAFGNCPSVKEVLIEDIAAWCQIDFATPESNPTYANGSSDGVLLHFNGEVIVDLVIPNGVGQISNYAFRNCGFIETVEMPYSLTKIGDGAFTYCYALKSVRFSDNLISIGNDVFFACTSLTSISLPKSLKSIGESAFGGFLNISDVYYEGSEQEWELIKIGKWNECIEDATKHYNCED